VGGIRLLLYRNSSLYDGLHLQLTKRISHGFQVQGSFTWSKSIDTNSGGIVGDWLLNGISSSAFYDPRLTKGLSDYHVPRVLSINYLWYVPTPKTGFAKEILSGWMLGGNFSASDGVPFTPVLVGDPLGTNSHDPFGYPDRLTGPGCNSLSNSGNVTNYIKLQCFAVPPAVNVGGTYYQRRGNGGRNIIRGPALQTLDLSVVKNTPVRRISETFNVQFRAEMFNVLNRANFSPPIDTEFIMDPSIAGFGIVPANPQTNYVSNAGAIDATTTPSRQIQFALKLIW
jgi:hypothetical protein